MSMSLSGVWTPRAYEPKMQIASVGTHPLMSDTMRSRQPSGRSIAFREPPFASRQRAADRGKDLFLAPILSW